ncbi:hypothetical protein BC835DRAFT_1353483, partial [Cytidiella melzeri]
MSTSKDSHCNPSTLELGLYSSVPLTPPPPYSRQAERGPELLAYRRNRDGTELHLLPLPNIPAIHV